MIIVCGILGLESGYFDAQTINNICYYGSIDLCNKLRLSIQHSPGFYGSITSLFLFVFFAINNKKEWI